MLARDIAVVLFGFWALIFKRSFQIKSFKVGKLFTALQFLALIALVFHIVLPSFIFYIFYFLGLLAFLELFFTMSDQKKNQ